MAIEAGMACVKYLLFVFNLLFALTGLVILAVGAHLLISAAPYMDLTSEGFFTSAPSVMIIAGCIIFVVAFFGCWGSVKENHCMILTFSIFLLMIFVVEISIGIAGYMKHAELENAVVRSLNTSIHEYSTNPEVKKTFDMIQIERQCCGLTGPGDWAANNLPIPDSCCSGQEIRPDGTVQACSQTSPDFHSEGCVKKVVQFLKDKALVLAGVGLGIAFVQLLGVVFSCYLARSIRNQYETV